MGRNGLWFFIRLVQADAFLCKPKKKKKCHSKTVLKMFSFRKERVVTIVNRALRFNFTLLYSVSGTTVDFLSWTSRSLSWF